MRWGGAAVRERRSLISLGEDDESVFSGEGS